MANFDKYTQTELGVKKTTLYSFDTQRAKNTNSVVYLPAGTALPDNLERLKISNGQLVAMSAVEINQQSAAIQEFAANEIAATIAAPDPQVDVLAYVILEQLNEVRAALNLPAADLESLKARALKVGLARRGSNPNN